MLRIIINSESNCSKRQLICDELNVSQPRIRQKVSRKRESIIIIHDENDDSFRTSKPKTMKIHNSKKKNPKGKISRINTKDKNDSVIILEEDENQGW